MDKSMIALILIVLFYIVAKRKLLPYLAKRKAEKQGIQNDGGVGATAPALDLSGMGLDAVKGGSIPGGSAPWREYCGIVPLSALSAPAPSPAPGKSGFNCAVIDLFSDDAAADLDSDGITDLERARLCDSAALDFKRQVDAMLSALNNRGAYDVTLDYLPCGVRSYLVCATYKLPSTAL